MSLSYFAVYFLTKFLIFLGGIWYSLITQAGLTIFGVNFKLSSMDI